MNDFIGGVGIIADAFVSQKMRTKPKKKIKTFFFTEVSLALYS